MLRPILSFILYRSVFSTCLPNALAANVMQSVVSVRLSPFYLLNQLTFDLDFSFGVCVGHISPGFKVKVIGKGQRSTLNFANMRSPVAYVRKCSAVNPTSIKGAKSVVDCAFCSHIVSCRIIDKVGGWSKFKQKLIAVKRYTSTDTMFDGSPVSYMYIFMLFLPL